MKLRLLQTSSNKKHHLQSTFLALGGVNFIKFSTDFICDFLIYVKFTENIYKFNSARDFEIKKEKITIEFIFV